MILSIQMFYENERVYKLLRISMTLCKKTQSKPFIDRMLCEVSVGHMKSNPYKKAFKNKYSSFNKMF